MTQTIRYGANGKPYIGPVQNDQQEVVINTVWDPEKLEEALQVKTTTTVTKYNSEQEISDKPQKTKSKKEKKHEEESSTEIGWILHEERRREV